MKLIARICFRSRYRNGRCCNRCSTCCPFGARTTCCCCCWDYSIFSEPHLQCLKYNNILLSINKQHKIWWKWNIITKCKPKNEPSKCSVCVCVCARVWAHLLAVSSWPSVRGQPADHCELAGKLLPAWPRGQRPREGKGWSTLPLLSSCFKYFFNGHCNCHDLWSAVTGVTKFLHAD